MPQLQHLIRTPNKAIGKIWQIFTSVDNELNLLKSPKAQVNRPREIETIKAKYPLHKNMTQIRSGLIYEMANVYTDYREGANPCGAGQISRLLAYGAAVIPQLNPFNQKLISVPEDREMVNEYIADITRQVGILENEGVTDETDQKESIKMQFVSQNQLMTPEVFDAIYERYENQLMGLD